MDVNDDAQLLSRSREGDAGAYAQLYERHVGTALHVARQLTDEAEDVVSDAFTRTYTVLREGRGPDVAFRPYLLRAVRNAAMDRHRRVRRVTPRESLEEAETPLGQEQPRTDPVIDQLEQQLVARAFQSLPERWQMVLWHTEVQGETPAQVAPLLGISPRAVAQLAVRAREGLRTAWLREHVVSAPPGHEEMVSMLGAHIRRSLGLRDRRALEAHLAECADCRRLRDELKDVNSRLGVILVPALLGLSTAKLAWDAQPAAAAVIPAAEAAAAATPGPGSGGPAGGAATKASGTAGTAAGGSGTAGVAAGGSATAGAAAGAAAAGVSGPPAAGSLLGAGGLLGATMTALSQPVTAGLVAAAVATTGFGAYVAVSSRPAQPAAPSDSRPAQITPGSPSGSGTAPALPGGSSGSSGSPGISPPVSGSPDTGEAPPGGASDPGGSSSGTPADGSGASGSGSSGSSGSGSSGSGSSGSGSSGSSGVSTSSRSSSGSDDSGSPSSGSPSSGSPSSGSPSSGSSSSGSSSSASPSSASSSGASSSSASSSGASSTRSTTPSGTSSTATSTASTSSP
ncbi:sigma-70 family RNA polymerase sigma factor [Geodermatophilus sp. URMC 62]|uniref:sigma-70 family RNA polymerase sigma factor n=1 Tax=Geodermatophilus sp. URMC 62 TaxID=3423414 RepID=UPI00406CF069